MGFRAYVVCSVSNEAPYLAEWMAHYLGLGFDGAILFTYGCEDGTDQIAARLAEMGHAHVFPMDVKSRQDPVRKGVRLLQNSVKDLDVEWFLPVEITEFLEIRSGDGTLSSLFDACEGADAISFCRRRFGSSGQRGLHSGTVREAYRMAAAEKDIGHRKACGIKTMFRANKASRITPHRPYFANDGAGVNWVDGGGRQMPKEYLTSHWTALEGFSNTNARLNFYATPSPETVLLRNGIPTNDQAITEFSEVYGSLDVNSVSETSMNRAIELSSSFMQVFEADATLSKLNEDGRSWHQNRMDEILKDGRIAALCDELASNAAARAEAVVEPLKEAEDAPTDAALEADGDSKKAVKRSSPRTTDGGYEPPPVRPIRFKIKPSPTGEMKAVLHGGFHKTATTYLQRMLEDNKKYLGRQSVYMVPHQKLRKHITYPSQVEAYHALNFDWGVTFTDAQLRRFSKEFFAEPIELNPRRIILSDENLAGLPSHCAKWGHLYRMRKQFFYSFAKRIPFPISDAFFAIRNYADFFASAYVQYLRSLTGTSTGALKPPEHMKLRVYKNLPNWSQVFDDFRAAFPGTRLHIWRFEDFRDLSPRILSEICGDTVDIKKLDAPKKPKERTSASGRAVEELVLLGETEGTALMSGSVKDLQEQYPLGETYGSFDPWSEGERAHLTALYERDWQALCKDRRINTLTL